MKKLSLLIKAFKKSEIFTFALILSSFYSIGQATIPSDKKEIKVDWDKKNFETALPVDESFILVIYSKNTLPTSFSLIRYIERGTFYYLDQSIKIIETTTNEKKAKIVQTTSVTTKDGAGNVTGTEISEEYDGDPKEIAPNVVKYSVSPLRADFYYVLMETSVFDNAKKEKKDIETKGINAKKDEYPISNTFLSYSDYAKRKVTAILGVSYFDTGTEHIRPYLGFRYNFIPINRDMRAKYYNDMHYRYSMKSFLSRFSLDLGVSFGTIEDSLHRQYDLFNKNNLLTGLGFRISDGFFISGGTIWHTLKDDSNPLEIKNKINNSFFVSLSFDWDFGKSFDALKKGLGVGE